MAITANGHANNIMLLGQAILQDEDVAENIDQVTWGVRRCVALNS